MGGAQSTVKCKVNLGIIHLWWTSAEGGLIPKGFPLERVYLPLAGVCFFGKIPYLPPNLPQAGIKQLRLEALNPAHPLPRTFDVLVIRDKFDTIFSLLTGSQEGRVSQ